MSGECQVNVKSQSELDIGGRETCSVLECRPIMESQVVILAQIFKLSLSCPLSLFSAISHQTVGA